MLYFGKLYASRQLAEGSSEDLVLMKVGRRECGTPKLTKARYGVSHVSKLTNLYLRNRFRHNSVCSSSLRLTCI